MRFLYTIGVRLYGGLLWLASWWNPKAADWCRGRKAWKQDLTERTKDFGDSPRLWFHVASMGEYEQAAPIIEVCRSRFPEYRIVLSFFSPSGYNHWVGRNVADAIVYLPLDTVSNARFFIETVRPWKAIFIKYEYWFNFIDELRRKRVPLYFVASRFRDKQYFFRPWGKWFAGRFRSVSAFFVQDENSVKLLRSIGIENVFRAGDTRFDRVLEIAHEPAVFPILEKFIGGRAALISGSSWPEDERLMMDGMFRRKDLFCWVIVPHELQVERLQRLASMLRAKGFLHVFYSDIERNENRGSVSGQADSLHGDAENSFGNPEKADVLIVDRMGMLSKLYRYAQIAYIGGGFGKGIHNVLEAAAYSVPVLFGPNCRKFGEALGLAECGGGFVIENEVAFEKCMDRLSEKKERERCARIAGDFVAEGAGAVRMVIKEVFGNQEEEKE